MSIYYFASFEKDDKLGMMFSVLLSIYCRENPSFLRSSLNSVFSQTLLPNEVVLVKDGPLTQDLDLVIEEYAEKYSTLVVVCLPVNVGLGKALNEGLKYCSYDLVARMDTDDVAKEERFEKQIKVFTLHPDIDVVGTWIDEFETTPENTISIRKPPTSHSEIHSYAKERNPINHPTVMFRKKAVMAVGGYKHFLLFEDYYLWVRMLMNGSVFYNIQESLLFFRFSPEVFKRRGGWKYAMTELRFRNEMREMGFISNYFFLRSVLVRFIMRIAPNQVRSVLYKRFLR